MKQFERNNIDIWDIFSFYYRKDEEIVFLHTSQKDTSERYSILAHLPYLQITQRKEEVALNGKTVNRSFSELVDEWRNEQFSDLLDWPIQPELIGFVSYEQSPARFACYDELLLFDHQTGILRVAQFGKTDQNYWMNETITFDKNEKVEKIQGPAAIFVEQTRNEYIKSIEKMQAYMAAGDIYVANLTQRFEIWSDAQPFSVFSHLREYSPSPFSAFMQYPDWEMTQISSSVERFVSIQNRTLTTKPIKGTIARGKTLESDLKHKKELENNPKERSELLMVTDLLRNDVARISQPFSLSVAKFAKIETFPHVHQLVTSIKSQIKEELTFSEFMKALFPGGSITGTPKKRAMEIIEEIEKSPRGLYTGMQGWLNRKMDLDMNIVIRTLVYDGKCYRLGVGGGITYESNPAAEFDEILLKAKPFLTLFNIDTVPTPLFTTGKVEKGKLHNLSAHVERLEKQYHHNDLRKQLESFAQTVQNGVLRVSTDGDTLEKTVRTLPKEKETYRVKLAEKEIEPSVLTQFKISGPRFQKIFHQEVEIAKEQGYGDVLFHSRGLVTELSIGNFLARRGEVYETPNTQALSGTYLDLFSQNHKVIHKDISLSDLKKYDAFYMTNAVRGLVEIDLEL